jgi:hypothetical protein
MNINTWFADLVGYLIRLGGIKGTSLPALGERQVTRDTVFFHIVSKNTQYFELMGFYFDFIYNFTTLL